MEVQFATSRLRRCYEDAAKAIQVWGPDVGRKYVLRIELLYAAAELDDLYTIKSLHFHGLTGDRAVEYSLTIQGRWRLILTDGGDHGIRVKEVTNHYGD